MKRYIRRWTAVALAFVVASAVCAPPALADTGSSPRPQTSLTKLSAANLTVLQSNAGPANAQTSASSDTAFFKTKRGAAVAALLVAGVAFTVWSARHDREPVKSPIR